MSKPRPTDGARAVLAAMQVVKAEQDALDICWTALLHVPTRSGADELIVAAAMLRAAADWIDPPLAT